MTSHRSIRTPDQRLRVFLSSSLGELAAEREAARAAIEWLRLTPVMFELGARPHPPRELYRAYLEQSDVFVGIYWQRYGWVAPGETISGLEDEYRLAGEWPRLLYLKSPAPDREARLTELVEEFESDGAVSYKRFSDPDELAELLANDLAVMLSERFERPAQPAAMDGAHDTQPTNALARSRNPPPVPLTETLGRTEEIETVVALLARGVRLVTLTGPGGVGKTRLAIEVALDVARVSEWEGSVQFIPLAAVSDPAFVMRTIADRLAVKVDGALAAGDALADYLERRAALLVLDNFEQVVQAGPDLVRLLERCPHVQMLVTSRHLLRVSGEHDVPVRSLALPDVSQPAAQLAGEPAVRLFVDRARAVAPTFELGTDNAAAVASLCARLDGLPLAIELAAARVRLLSPAALLERLDEQLDLLSGGHADLPERQRTLRNTIEWSHQLLDDAERAVFARLSGFAGGWTLEAAEAVCDDDLTPPVLDVVASLLDKSLVTMSDDAGAGPRLSMLETVRAFAAEQLAARGEVDRVRRRHLDWYLAIGKRAQPYLCGPGQEEHASRFDPERANLRFAVATALDVEDDEAVIELTWDVIVFYFIRDALDEPISWLEAVAAAGRPLDAIPRAKLRSLSALLAIARGDYGGAREPLEWSLSVFRARGMAFEAAVTLKEIANVHYVVDEDVESTVEALSESSRLFEGIGHDWGVALTEAMLGTVRALSGDLAAADEHQRRSLDRARAIANEPLEAQAIQQRAMVKILAGPDGAVSALAEVADYVSERRDRTVTSYCLDALAAVAAAQGDATTAARCLAAAQAARTRVGTSVWPTVQAFVDTLTAQVCEEVGEERFRALVDSADALDPFDVFEETYGALAGTSAPISR